jgi:Holliday junction resolvase RusA-like endonuclease
LGPVNLKAQFYFGNRKNEPDLSNLYQGIEDVLQKAGVIQNDKQIVSHDGSRKIFGESARVEIELTEGSL